ncbi:MAG: DUF3991 domain-containing protein, partial [Ruminococcus sp.]|nr:DUF3991 domain-containing protein [Ruminococcus sp.]
MYYSDEQIRRANERGIVEYFSQQGYSCKHSGSQTHIEGFGGFYVKDSTEQFYIHSRQKGGKGLVSCLMKVFDMPFTEAMKNALDGEPGSGISERDNSHRYSGVPKPECKPPGYEKPQFIKPEQGEDNRKVFAYLTKTRCISPEAVNAFIRAKLLYQDKKGNAVFLHTVNGKSCGAEIHGTGGKKYRIGNTEYKDISDKSFIPAEPCAAEIFGREYENSDIKFAGYVYENNANIVIESKDCSRVTGIISDISSRDIDREEIRKDVFSKLKNYKGVAPGTTESYFRFSLGRPKGIYVFESCIDLMSFMTLH